MYIVKKINYFWVFCLKMLKTIAAQKELNTILYGWKQAKAKQQQQQKQPKKKTKPKPIF